MLCQGRVAAWEGLVLMTGNAWSLANAAAYAEWEIQRQRLDSHVKVLLLLISIWNGVYHTESKVSNPSLKPRPCGQKRLAVMPEQQIHPPRPVKRHAMPLNAARSNWNGAQKC